MASAVSRKLVAGVRDHGTGWRTALALHDVVDRKTSTSAQHAKGFCIERRAVRYVHCDVLRPRNVEILRGKGQSHCIGTLIGDAVGQSGPSGKVRRGGHVRRIEINTLHTAAVRSCEISRGSAQTRSDIKYLAIPFDAHRPCQFD